MSAKTVTVACKLPNGLHLVLRDPKTGAPQWEQTVAGTGIKRDQESMIPLPNQAPQEFGFALTPNVDATFWELWLHEHSRLPAVVNGLIFAHSAPADLKAESREKEAQTTGLEPVERDKPEKFKIEGKDAVLETATK